MIRGSSPECRCSPSRTPPAVLRRRVGEENVSFSDHNLYEHAVRLFTAACNGQGAPAASGVDGVKSLAVAAAVKQAALTGKRVAVDYGGL